MTRSTTLLAAAMIAGGLGAASAKPYSGDCTVSFFNDPGSTFGASYCLALTQTGGINGFTNSGTFADTEGYGLAGDFLAHGKTFHLVFLTTTYGDSVDLIGKAAKAPSGAYDNFFPGSYLLSTGNFTLAPGCTDAARRPSSHHTTTY